MQNRIETLIRILMTGYTEFSQIPIDQLIVNHVVSPLAELDLTEYEFIFIRDGREIIISPSDVNLRTSIQSILSLTESIKNIDGNKFHISTEDYNLVGYNEYSNNWVICKFQGDTVSVINQIVESLWYQIFEYD